jgi:hypothetical protein
MIKEVHMTNLQSQHVHIEEDLPTSSIFTSDILLTDAHCRICLESGAGLMELCSTIRYVHEHCMKLWIECKE